VFVVLCSRFWRQRDDVEFLPPTFASDQFLLGGPLIAGLTNGSFVLRAEVPFEPFGSLATGRGHGKNRNERDHRYDHYCYD
jgi:hypothetical protein